MRRLSATVVWCTESFEWSATVVVDVVVDMVSVAVCVGVLTELPLFVAV